MHKRMATEPELKTIPVELAIQRDMEFKMKLKRLKLRSMIDSGTGFFPSQAPSSPSPRLVPGCSPSTVSGGSQQKGAVNLEPSPAPLPSTLFGTSKGKEPVNQEPSPPPSQLSSLAIVALPETNPTKSYGLFCDICKVTCLNDLNYKQHVEGKKHKAMLRETARSGKWCEICDVWCMPGCSYQQHIEGQKHKDKLKGTRELRFCELCNVWCTDGSLFQSHLRGKTHTSKLARGYRPTQ